MNSLLHKIGVRPLRNSNEPYSKLEWTALAVGCGLCGVVMIAVAKLLGVPAEPAFNGSLLAGPSPVLAVVAVVIGAAIATIIAVVVAMVIEEEGGLFCLAAGLAILGLRCGGARPIYQSGKPALLPMAVEVVLLGGIVLAAWWVIRKLVDPVRHRVHKTTDEIHRYRAPMSREVEEPTRGQEWTVAGISVAAAAVAEWLFIPADVPMQAVGGVAVATGVGVFVAYMYTAIADGFWYWLGPIGVAVIGYLGLMLAGGPGPTGDVTGWFGPLARVTPLGYAGAGTCGAIFGHWVGRRWNQDEPIDAADVNDPDAEPATA